MFVKLIIIMPYIRKKGLKFAVDRALHESINKYFELPKSSILPVLEDEYCERDLQNMKKNMVPYTNKNSAATEMEFMNLKDKGLVMNVWPESDIASESTYYLPEALMNSNGNVLRKQLIFKSEYRRFVQKMLKQIADNDRSGKEVMFVGMHSRRTDYIAFARDHLKKKVAGKSHFLSGIEYYKEEYPDHQIYFLAVSDDMAWVKKHLGGIKGVVLAGMADKNNQEKIPYGLDSVGIDLCLLASCNHTIMSQGAFGHWGGFLAGGDVYSTYGPMIWNILQNSDGN